MKLGILAALASCLLVLLPLRTPAPQVAPYPSCATYGDSIAAGYHLLAGQTAFPSDVEALLQHASPGNCARFTVDATSGYTAANELASLKARGITPPSSSLVVLEFGNNEFSQHEATPAQTAANIQQVLAYLAPTLRLNTLVCTSLWESGSNAYGAVADYSAAVFAGYAGRAIHVDDIDITTLYGEPSFHGGICCNDNFHPNVLGAEAIAEAIDVPLASPTEIQSVMVR